MKFSPLFSAVSPARCPPAPWLAVRVAVFCTASCAALIAPPAWAQFQALTSGTQEIASYTSGEIIVSLMIIGYCFCAIALKFNQRLGMYGFLIVTAAGAAAAASPDMARGVFNLFRGRGAGPILNG